MVKAEVKGCFVLGFMFMFWFCVVAYNSSGEVCEFVFMLEVHTEKNSLKSIFSILVLLHSLFNIQY